MDRHVVWQFRVPRSKRATIQNQPTLVGFDQNEWFFWSNEASNENPSSPRYFDSYNQNNQQILQVKAVVQYL